MGKGKAKNRNAFFFFMQDFRNQSGRSFGSMAEVATAASPYWQNLSPQQKQIYEQMARHSKKSYRKQTSLGEDVEAVLQEKKEKEDREIAMKQEIDNIVRKGVNIKTIGEEYFFIMHINEFCYWERQAKYFPAEIALGKFSLKEGILSDNVYSSLVHPGPLPLGFLAHAKLQADKTHQIQHMGDDNNLQEVLMAIIAKLREGDTDKFPPIYVSDDNILIVENVLGNMCNDYGYPNDFTIYSLQYLLFSLKNNLSKTGEKVWPTISVSKMQLQNDVYDYCSGIACAYHETADIPVHCSRSRIVRWAYIVCDNCNIDLDLPLVNGRHVPLNALNDPELYARAASTLSWRAEQVAGSYAHSDIASSSKQGEDTSEPYTNADESNTSSYHGFDSDSVSTNEDEVWSHLSRITKYKYPESWSKRSDFCSPLSQSSTNSEYIPGRRPLSQSLANPGVRRPTNPMRGRGRGRGLVPAGPSA